MPNYFCLGQKIFRETTLLGDLVSEKEQMNLELMNAAVDLPLSDGTLCRITQWASVVLKDHFGITRARLRKGAGNHVDVVVKPSPAKHPDATEVPLRDLLAVFCYRLAGDAEPGDKWTLADGDCRNLMPQNIVIAKAQPKKKIAVPAETQDESPKYDATNLSAIAQVEKLNEIYPALLRKAGAIIGDPIPDPEEPNKKLDEARGPEIVAKVVARLVERVWAGEAFPNIVALAKASVQKSAEQELWAKNLKQSPIRVDAGHKTYLKRFAERFGPNAFLSTDGVMYGFENQDGESE